VVFDEYAGQVAPIEWHYWGGDPFYSFDSTEIAARAAYYSVSYVPHFRYDGKKISDLFGTAPAYPEFFLFFRHALDSLLAIPSPFRINLTQYPGEDWDSVYVSFDVVAVDTVQYDTTPDLYLAVVEKYHTYPGYPQWDYSFRDIIPDADGEVITIQKGDSLHFDWVYPINDIYNLDAIITTVFIQNDRDESITAEWRNKVMQAANALVNDVSGVAAGDMPSVIYLGKCSPNPFTTQTSIAYALGTAGRVRLAVYSPTGQLVTSLVDAEAKPGAYQATWDGRDRFGREVGSGVYYYQLELNNTRQSGRMVVLK
jgi:hypothetical protein